MSEHDPVSEEVAVKPNAWIGSLGTIVTGELYLDHRFPGLRGETFTAGRIPSTHTKTKETP